MTPQKTQNLLEIAIVLPAVHWSQSQRVAFVVLGQITGDLKAKEEVKLHEKLMTFVEATEPLPQLLIQFWYHHRFFLVDPLMHIDHKLNWNE